MSRPILIERTTGIGIAAAVLTAGIVVGAGAFFGGYALGESQPAPVPTELAERTYTATDLEQALEACEIEGVAVEDASVTLLGGEHPATKRQCMVRQIDAPPLAQTEYEYWGAVEVSGGEYSWSNVRMAWEQTDEGRDVTITVR